MLKLLAPVIIIQPSLGKENIKQYRRKALYKALSEGLMYGLFFLLNLVVAIIISENKPFGYQPIVLMAFIHIAVICAFLALLIWKQTKLATLQHQVNNEFERIVLLQKFAAMTEKELQAAKSLLRIEHSFHWELRLELTFLALVLLGFFSLALIA